MLGNEILYSVKSKRPRVYFTFDDVSAGFGVSVWHTSTSSDVQFAYDIFKQGFDRGLWGFTNSTVDKPVAPTSSWKPGTQGFGVGVCKEDYVSLNMEPLPGCDDVKNDNYGNYIHKPSGSIMCWIPAFKYRVNDKFVNSVEVWLADDPECPSNAVLHRAFIDGGKEKSGFFCDKYICSPDANNTMGISVKNGSTLSIDVLNNISHGNVTGQLEGCVGDLIDVITASRARGAGFQCMSVFQLGALRLLVLAHAQASNSAEFNAWYDSSGQHNLPRGNTNKINHSDYYDRTISWTKDPKCTVKGLTGSCSVFAKSTHNGQNNGVADLKGILLQALVGYIGQKLIKHSVSVGSLNKDSAYDIANYNSYDISIDTGTYSMHVWDPDTIMFTNDTSGINYEFMGFMAPSIHAGVSRTEVGMFEGDEYQIDDGRKTTIVPYYGSSWAGEQNDEFGLFYTRTHYTKDMNSYTMGFRTCAYVM